MQDNNSWQIVACDGNSYARFGIEFSIFLHDMHIGNFGTLKILFKIYIRIKFSCIWCRMYTMIYTKIFKKHQQENSIIS